VLILPKDILYSNKLKNYVSHKRIHQTTLTSVIQLHQSPQKITTNIIFIRYARQCITFIQTEFFVSANSPNFLSDNIINNPHTEAYSYLISPRCYFFFFKQQSLYCFCHFKHFITCPFAAHTQDSLPFSFCKDKWSINILLWFFSLKR